MIKAVVEGRKMITRRLSGLSEINHFPSAWIVKDGSEDDGKWLFHTKDLMKLRTKKPLYLPGLPTALTKHTYEDCENYKAQFQPRIAALESQLKPVSGLIELDCTELACGYPTATQECPYTKKQSCPIYNTAQIVWRKARQGMVELDENQRIELINGETIPHFIKRLRKAGFRKVKLGKGETK